MVSAGSLGGNPEFDGPPQAAVYLRYLYLRSLAPGSSSLAGKLVLSLGFRMRGAELALATAIAGGAFLGLEPEPQWLKNAVRTGACDFMVNTLDEALRVLKNEIRKGTPVSAGLLGEVAASLNAIAERGVQPDWIAMLDEREPTSRAAAEDFHRIVARGSAVLDEDPPDAGILRSDLVTWRASTPRDIRRMDRIALEMLPQDDAVRKAWLTHAPAYFSRRLPPERALTLKAPERRLLLTSIEQAARETPFQAGASLEWLDEQGAPRVVKF